jgi:bacillopeptidase F
MNAAGPQEMLPIILLLDDAVDPTALKERFRDEGLPVHLWPGRVMRALKQKAEDTQPALVAFITRSGLPHSQIQRYWISNSISLSANVAMIQALALRNDIAYIDLNIPEFGLVEPTKGASGPPKSPGGIEPGLAAIRAPELWAMGYSGHARLAMTFDTGVWPEHPSLKNRFLPNRMPLASTWKGFDSAVPIDKASSHGTHVSGIMLGLDTATADTIGVAPGAYFIATDPIVSNLAFVKPLSDLMLGFEWALNPDGDEDTWQDVPDVINNSWGRPNTIQDQDWGPCSPFVTPVMQAVEAAGIANVISAGNSGPNASTIGIPTNINVGLVNTFSVGAVNGNANAPYPIAIFSSRGPSVCGGEGSLLIKPEVVAPGVGVRSAVDSHGYDMFSGTSMAAPHVSGAVLLLKEAFPYLPGEDLLMALYLTAIDQGDPGEDNVFGMGMIDVKAAFDYLATDHTPLQPATPLVDLEIVEAIGPDRAIMCPDQGSAVAQVSLWPQVRVQNNGLLPTEGITIHYSSGEVNASYSNAVVAINPGESVWVQLPQVVVPGQGFRELHFHLEPLDGEYDPWNNHAVVRWHTLPVLAESGIFEDFEEGISPEKWHIENPDADITWAVREDVVQPWSMNETGKSAWVNHHAYSLIANQKDRLISAPLSQVFDLYSSFSYSYRKRNSGNFQNDTLRVYYVPCTGMYSEIEVFKKGGAELATVEGFGSNALPQAPTDWETVYLFDGFNEGPYYVVFETTNRRGNNLFLDHISLQTIIGTRDQPKGTDLRIYPNPAYTEVRVSWSHEAPHAQVRIIDLSGRTMGAQWVQRDHTVSLAHLPKGLYLLEATFKEGMRQYQKLVLQ